MTKLLYLCILYIYNKRKEEHNTEPCIMRKIMNLPPLQVQENENRLKTLKNTYSKAGLTVFVSIVAVSAVQILLTYLRNYFIDQGMIDKENINVNLLITFLPMYVVCFPLMFLMMKKLPATAPSEEKLGGKRFFALLAMCFPVMFAGNLVGNLLSGLFSGGQATNGLMNMMSTLNPITILFVVGFAPVFEELFFRKYLINRTVKYGEKTAILFSGLCFGMFHLNLFQFFYAFGLGLIFAYIYVRTGKVIYSIIMHMLINLNGSVISVLAVSQLDTDKLQAVTESGKFTGEAMEEILPGLMIYGIYLVVYMLLVCIGIVLLIINRKKLLIKPTEEEVPAKEGIKLSLINVGMILFTVLTVIMIVLNLIV